MPDFTSCPSCRRPLVVPNSAKCSCGAELGSGSRERTTPADPSGPPEPKRKALLTVAMQSEAQVALLQALTETGVADVFHLGHDLRSMKDSELGLPLGTLGRELALGLGKPPELFADVPQFVTLLTFSEKVAASSCAERIDQLARLTAVARQAAASPATRVLFLHPSDRLIPPEAFLRLSESRPGEPGTELLVWLDLLGGNGDMKTRGLDTFGLPEVLMSLGPNAEEAAARAGMDLMFTVAHQMLQRKGPLDDGTRIGTPGVKMFEVTSQDGVLRLAAAEESQPAQHKPSAWKRFFS